MNFPKQLKTVDDLIEIAGSYAEFCLTNDGTMPPSFFFIGDEGPMFYDCREFTDDEDKEVFETIMRILCMSYKASACVTALESWMTGGEDGGEVDPSIRPTEAMNRREVIWLLGDDRLARKTKMMPIIRSDNGKFFSLVDKEIIIMDEMGGRFAQILSPNSPDAEGLKFANEFLARYKVIPMKIGKAG